MEQLPDIEAIEATVAAIESRATVDRSGRDLDILGQLRDRVADVLPLDTPDGYPSKDALRALLGRIEDVTAAVQQAIRPGAAG